MEWIDFHSAIITAIPQTNITQMGKLFKIWQLIQSEVIWSFVVRNICKKMKEWQGRVAQSVTLACVCYQSAIRTSD